AFFSDKGVRNIRKILVLLKGNDSDELVVNTASVLASANNAAITIAKERRVGTAINQNRERELVEKLLIDKNQSGQRVSIIEVAFDDKAESIVEHSVDFDL